MGIGSVTAHITASGAGFNPTKPGAHTLANVSVGSAIYKGHDYRNIGLHAELGNGDFKVNLNSPDPDLDLTLDAYGTVAPDDYTFDIRARINHIDLHTPSGFPKHSHQATPTYTHKARQAPNAGFTTWI